MFLKKVLNFRVVCTHHPPLPISMSLEYMRLIQNSLTRPNIIIVRYLKN